MDDLEHRIVVAAEPLVDPRRVPTLLIAVLTAAVAVMATAWYLRLALPGHRTGARVAVWTDSDGQPFDTTHWSGCHTAGYTFDGLVVGQTVTLACAPGPGFAAGALARIDPVRDRAEVLWPFPEALGEPRWVVGLRPGPDQQLAIVVRLDDDTLAGGIAGARGWIAEPVRLPGGPKAAVGEVRWIEGHVEIAIAPWDLEPTADNIAPPGFAIVHLAAEAIIVRTIPRREICKGGACWFEDAWFDVDGDRWVWLVQGMGNLTITAGIGHSEIVGDDDIVGRPSPVARGVLEPSYYQLQHYPREIDLTSSSVRPRLFTAIGQALVELARDHDDETDVYTLAGPDRTWRIGIDPAERDRPDRLWLAIGEQPWTPVAAVGTTGAPVLITLDTTTHVVFPDGEHVAVDAGARRLDPLSVEDHLRRGGSLLPTIDQPGHVWQARVAWWGLPVLLVAAIALAGRWRGRLRLDLTLAVAGVGYLLIGGALLTRFADLL